MGTPRPELRRVREQTLGITQKELARRLGVHLNTVSAVEAGNQTPKGERFRRWAEELGMSHQKLSAVLDGTYAKGQGEDNAHLVPTKFGLFAAVEATARRLQVYSRLPIAGLLQTEAYARVLVENDLGLGSATDQQVAIRLKRQKALTREEDPLEYSAILHEASLHVEVGSNRTMTEQFERLEYLAERPNIELRMLPFSAGMSHLDRGGFVLVTLPYGDGPGMVYEDLYKGSNNDENIDYVNKITRTWNDLHAMCLDAEQTLSTFARMKRRYSA